MYNVQCTSLCPWLEHMYTWLEYMYTWLKHVFTWQEQLYTDWTIDWIYLVLLSWLVRCMSSSWPTSLLYSCYYQSRLTYTIVWTVTYTLKDYDCNLFFSLTHTLAFLNSILPSPLCSFSSLCFPTCALSVLAGRNLLHKGLVLLHLVRILECKKLFHNHDNTAFLPA